MSKLKSPTCLWCEKKKAQLPKEEKIFCSQRCGYEWAVNHQTEYGPSETTFTWCGTCGEWQSGFEECDH